MRKLLVYMKNYRAQSVAAPLFKMTEALFELFVPLVVARIVDDGIGGGDRTVILSGCGILALLAVIGLALAVAAQFFASRAACGFASAVRKALYDKVMTLPASKSDALGTNRLITMLTGDVVQLQTGVNMVLRLFMRSPVVVFGAVIMAFIADPRGLRGSGSVFLAVVPLLGIAVFSVMLISIRRYKTVRGASEDLTLEVREDLKGNRVFRSFGQESARIARGKQKNEKTARALIAAGRVSALTGPLTLIIVNLGIIALLYFGGVSVKKGDLSTGTLIALYNYMSQILIELVKLANLIVTVTKSAACAERIEKTLATDGTVERLSKELCPDEDDLLRFENVSFVYPDGTKALTGVSFSVKRGQTLGIIGGTGAGKTSVVGLIPRFYDPTAGRVLFKGRDVRSLDEKELRSRIGLVPQKAELFSGTIRDNLLWGNPQAGDGELWEALRAAGAEEFVSEKGLDGTVEQFGRNFSGGQKQRLTIARALVRRPELLILDDSTSALDFATEAALRRAISSLPYHLTVVTVSQRTSSLRQADAILVLDNGTAVGFGTHGELLETCGVYQEIYMSQFEKREGGDA